MPYVIQRWIVYSVQAQIQRSCYNIGVQSIWTPILFSIVISIQFSI